ncbi:MAG: TatD family hydrolase [Candidatus Methanomethylophilaceae archaeon]|nr:TatD family hydrolase [Candidatus Methanomethylophilaceae archaeon]
MSERVPAYDNHIHMSPSGRNAEALKEFQAAGGTGLTLVTLPYKEVQVSCGKDFSDSYEITYRLAAKAEVCTDLKINIAVGPYPVLILSLAERFGLERAEEIMIEGMEYAARDVSEGKAVAIGEIGRPHFPVPAEIREASDRVLLRGMELAKENSCPVIIHCESDGDTNRSLSELADRAGLKREMVVKHSSPPLVTGEETFGVMPSIPASKSNIKAAISKGTDRFMIETDYIDDPEKPGAIMSVTTVPKKVSAWVANGQVPVESIYRICGDIPESLYGNRGAGNVQNHIRLRRRSQREHFPYRGERIFRHDRNGNRRADPVRHGNARKIPVAQSGLPGHQSGFDRMRGHIAEPPGQLRRSRRPSEGKNLSRGRLYRRRDVSENRILRKIPFRADKSQSRD